jgi:hypothetical protein
MCTTQFVGLIVKREDREEGREREREKEGNLLSHNKRAESIGIG